MNKRHFLKLISLIPFASSLGIQPPTKRYITECPWEKLVGVRMEWEERLGINPVVGDWKIVSRVPQTFQYEGEWYKNYRMNKVWIQPVSNAPIWKLCWFSNVRRNDRNDYAMADLSYGRFYVLE